MKHLYIVSLVLQRHQSIPAITTKQYLAYRGTDTEEEALGLVVKQALAKFPDFGVQSYTTMEVLPIDIAEMYQVQKDVLDTAVAPMDGPEFRAAYIKAFEGDTPPTEFQIEASWQAYMRNPAGHFLSKEKS